MPAGGNIPFAEDVPHYFRAHNRGIIVFAIEVHLLHTVVLAAIGEGVEGDLERLFFLVTRGVPAKPETCRINGITHSAVVKDKY